MSTMPSPWPRRPRRGGEERRPRRAEPRRRGDEHRHRVGGALVGHGTQKLFGWFGGLGRHRTGAFFELLGYRPGVLFAVIAGLSEAGGGALLASGFLTPLAGAAVIGVMLNAASALRGRGPWATNGGWEYPVVLATVGATIVLTGPGSVSVDHALGLDWATAWGVGGVVLGVAAAIATLLLRRPPAAPASEAGGQRAPVGEVA
jgi:putative oxidoreductase